jgi:hypothetical protein
MFPEEGLLNAPILNWVSKVLKNPISWNFIASSQVREHQVSTFFVKTLDSIL